MPRPFRCRRIEQRQVCRSFSPDDNTATENIQRAVRLLDLFLSFAKVGLFTFGGGYAMIALIETYVWKRSSGLATMR